MSIIVDRGRLLLIAWAVLLGILLGSGVMSSCAPGRHRASGGEYVHESPSPSHR